MDDRASDSSPAAVGEREAAFIGRVISERYRIDSLIASGGMGAVFRGQHMHMRKRVAIKILHAEMEGLIRLAEQFEREAIAGAHVSHPNVASATDFGRLDDGSFFLVQEYLRGETLAEVLEKGPIAFERTVHIAKQVADALAAVHGMGIVHRDVKPANIMLVEGGNDEVKLIDFGFAKVPMDRMSVAQADDPLHEREGMWDPDTMFGTIGYLAPEASKGVDALDARSDLYALGVSMYEMLTGKRPFEAKKSSDLFRLHLTAPPPSFFERAPLVQVPAAIEGVVLRLLAKNPADRYQNGKEVIAALNRVVAAKPRVYPQQPKIDLGSIEIEPMRRSRLRPLLVGGLLVAAGLAVAWFVPPVREQLAEWGVVAAATTATSSTGSGPSSSPKLTEIDGLGAAAWAARLLAAPKELDWKGGVSALNALAQLDPTALGADAAASAAMTVAVGAAAVALDDPSAPDPFALLSQHFGSDGVDVLYRIVEKQSQKHPATKRALAQLRNPQTLARATPAARIAFELRDAPCEKAPELFERAASLGDARTLAVLEVMRIRTCRSATDACCFRTNKAFVEALGGLKARLKQKK